MSLNEEKLKLLKRCLEDPDPCFRCKEPNYSKDGVCCCSKKDRWDYDHSEEINKVASPYLYDILLSLHYNKKEFNELIQILVDELDYEGCCVSDFLDIV